MFVVGVGVGVDFRGSGTTGLTSEDEVEEELRIVPLGVLLVVECSYSYHNMIFMRVKIER